MIGRAIMLFSLIFLILSGRAGAQPLTLDKKLHPHQLELQDYPGGGGVRWAAGSGTSEAGPEYIWVGGLSPMQATEIHLLSLNPSVGVTMSLVQSSWKNDISSCTTDQTALCSFRFRTYGDVGVKVSGPEGAQWYLVAMTSPKIDAAALMPSPFFVARRADADKLLNTVGKPNPEQGGDSSGFGMVLKLVTVVLLAVIAGALVLLLKKRGAAVVAPFALLLLAGGWPEPGQAEFSESTKGILDALRNLEEAKVRNIEVKKAERAAVDSALAKLLERLKKLREVSELRDAYDPLNECSIIAEPPGAPRIPMFCEGDSECEACYAQARGEFNETRALFEQLRVIYQCTMADVKAKVAFGDSVSGIHAVTGLTWQVERAKIMQSVNGLKKAYDEKYAEFRRRLHQSMIGIAECEARYGLPDWYDRFGFVYYEFMSDRYRRND